MRYFFILEEMEQQLNEVRKVAELKRAGFKEAEAIELLNKFDVQSAADLERLLGRKESLLKRSVKALEKRRKLGDKDYDIIRQLNPLVGSVGNRNITFAGWASTEPSARSYIKEKKKKGWSVENIDLDKDGVAEVLVRDKDGIIRNQYRISTSGGQKILRKLCIFTMKHSRNPIDFLDFTWTTHRFGASL